MKTLMPKVKKRYNKVFWTDDGHLDGASRYVGCIDATGATHDYGYSFVEDDEGQTDATGGATLAVKTLPGETTAQDYLAQITVTDLTMAYGSFVLMRDLNFTINRGDIFIIMGGTLFFSIQARVISENKYSIAFSLMFLAVAVSTASSAYSNTRLSFPEQVTAPRTRLTFANGIPPPGCMIKRSNSSAPYCLGNSMRVRLVIAVPIDLCSRPSICSLLSTPKTVSSRRLNAESLS